MEPPLLNLLNMSERRRPVVAARTSLKIFYVKVVFESLEKRVNISFFVLVALRDKVGILIKPSYFILVLIILISV